MAPLKPKDHGSGTIEAQNSSTRVRKLNDATATDSIKRRRNHVHELQDGDIIDPTLAPEIIEVDMITLDGIGDNRVVTLADSSPNFTKQPEPVPNSKSACYDGLPEWLFEEVKDTGNLPPRTKQLKPRPESQMLPVSKSSRPPSVEVSLERKATVPSCQSSSLINDQTSRSTKGSLSIRAPSIKPAFVAPPSDAPWIGENYSKLRRSANAA